MEYIDKLKHPPVVGETYLVPCIISCNEPEDHQWWIEGKRVKYSKNFIEKYIFPIINHLHSDRENGQDYKHYHVDYRFVDLKKDENYLIAKKRHKHHLFAPHSRYDLRKEEIWYREDYKIEYYPLKCYRQEFHGTAGDTTKSKLKHRCIHKGKCPHRGYDLSQVVPVNGIITCPLHGLKFYADNGELKEDWL